MEENNIMPMITVVIIGYNIENYIQGCLESVLNQDYSDYDVIFVDDGSTDNTCNIAKNIALQNNKLQIVSKKNGGIVSARKAGLKEARGEYICFIDGDDIVNSDMLKHLAESIIGSSDRIDIVSSDMWREEKNGKYIAITNNIKELECRDNVFFELIMQDLAIHHMFPKLYRRKFLLEAGYLDYPEVTMAEDLMTNIFLGVNNPVVVFSNTINYYYRYNATSVSRIGNLSLLKQVQTLEYIEEYLSKNLREDKYRQLMDYQWFSYVYTYTNSPIHHSVKREMVLKCYDRLIGYKKNDFCKSVLDNNPWHLNIVFYMYYHKIFFAGAIDSILSGLKLFKLGMIKK